MWRVVLMVATVGWLGLAWGAPCPVEVLLSHFPEQFRVRFSYAHQKNRERALLIEGYTDAQIQTLILGWYRDLALQKYMRDRASEPVHEYLNNRGIRSHLYQLMVLQVLSPVQLGKVMHDAGTFSRLKAVNDTIEAFSVPASQVMRAIDNDLARLRSPDPVYTYCSRNYDSIFLALEIRTKRDAEELRDEFVRGCLTGKLPCKGSFAEAMLAYWRFAVPLY